ncbi:MAG: 3-deoxy-8-phosphooctulonate synthase [Gemmatimonadota bacterium]
MFQDFPLIAGPCVLEEDTLNLSVARALAALGEEAGIPVVFKASFDKANRSLPDAPRGPGLQEGLERLTRVREETGLPLLTDIHEPDQAGPAAEVADVLQIPAFLCRQTDLLTAAGGTGRPVVIKKGQWMAPEEMAGAVAKVRRGGGGGAVAVTERGTFFGYGDLVVDMRSFGLLREACGVPALFDATHSVQRPGARGGATGGDPRFIPALMRAAVAAGCDGLYLETHPDPGAAPSDGANMLPLGMLRSTVLQALEIRAALHE